jgi:hypothetical protein
MIEDIEIIEDEIEDEIYIEIIEHIETPRLFLETPFEEYTVIEGFCLVFTIALIIGVIHHFVRRFI